MLDRCRVYSDVVNNFGIFVNSFLNSFPIRNRRISSASVLAQISSASMFLMLTDLLLVALKKNGLLISIISESEEIKNVTVVTLYSNC